MAEDSQPLQPQQAPPSQSQSGQVPPQNAIVAVGTNLKNAAVNVLKEVRVDLTPADAFSPALACLMRRSQCRGSHGQKWWTEARLPDQPTWQRQACSSTVTFVVCKGFAVSWAYLQATGRLRKNANYFKVNYLVVIVTITAITMAMNPTSLIVLGVLALAWLWLFVIKQAPLVIGGRTFK